MKTFSFASRIILPALAIFASAGLWAGAAVTMQLDRSEIHQNETAELTINGSGSGNVETNPPVVAGLEFSAVSQSSQVEIVNGATTETSSVTYDVIPQAPGSYTIPAQDPSGKSLTLRVLPGNAAGMAGNPGGSAAPALPPPMIPGMAPATPVPDAAARGAAFLKMDLPKRPLYVGETVPVTIQIGLRGGTQPSLDGLPSLTSDAFTLDKLSDKPEQTQEEIDGQPYLILTWHSALAAVKTGDFLLAATSPVTIQVRVAPPRVAGTDDSDPDSIFSSFFQNFGGQVEQKSLNLASAAETIHVLPLPAEGQPANFSGAVGSFEIASSVTPSQAAAGDPITLRLAIKGSGSFDRVSTPMLNNVAGWKTYPPTVKFVPADSVGYSGEKDFEQAVIPLHPGQEKLPALSFAYFNPETRQYETRRTDPPAVDIAPGNAPPVQTPNAGAVAQPEAAIAPSDGLRPDEPETVAGLSTLRPLYFQPGFLIGQGLLALGFLGAGYGLRRREKLAADQALVRRRAELKAVEGFLGRMDAAASQRDATTFFISAHQALQHGLGWRWNMAPSAITVAEIDAHLNGRGEKIRRVFVLADQMAYSGNEPIEADFNAWKETVHQLVKETETL